MEAKKSKKDIPAEGSKNKHVFSSKNIPAATKEASMKPHAIPKEAAPLIEGVVISHKETAPLIEDASLKRLRRGLPERSKGVVVPTPSALTATIPSPDIPNSAKDLVKSWVVPNLQKVESSLPRKKITDLAAQHISSVSVVGLIPFSSPVMFAL